LEENRVEAVEQAGELAPSAEHQVVILVPLRHAGAVGDSVGQAVAFDDGDAVEEVD
jgi:hypothetical protein